VVEGENLGAIKAQTLGKAVNDCRKPSGFANDQAAPRDPWRRTSQSLNLAHLGHRLLA
jgi:hypothetical protein